MNFWANVEAELSRRNIAGKTLAEAVGVTPPAISKYRAGAIPNLQIAVRIAEFLGVSLDWLVWGPVGSAPRAVCESPEEHEFMRDILGDWKLRDLSMLAGLSPKEADWCILDAVVKQHPVPLSHAALRSRLPQFSESVLDATLYSLERSRLIRTLSSGADRAYASVYQVPVIPGTELRDVALNLKRAVRILFRDVLPALTVSDRRGHLLTASGRFLGERARWLTSELNELIKAKATSFTEDEPGDTDVHIVFGVAFKPPPS